MRTILSKGLSTGRRQQMVGGFDQVVSSASNFLLAIGIAQTSNARELGRFALIWQCYWLAIGVQRAFLSEPVLIVYGRSLKLDEARLAVAFSFLAAISVAVPGAFACLVTGSDQFALFFMFLIVVLGQDCMRIMLVALGRAGSAVCLDSVVLVAVVAGFTGPLTPSGSAEWIDLWAIGTGVACTFGVIAAGMMPRRGCIAMVRTMWPLNRNMVSEYLVISGVAQAAVFLIPLFSSLRAVGGLKVAQTASSPISVLFAALILVGLPVLSKAYKTSGFHELRRRAAAYAVFLAASAGLYSVVLLILPAHFAESLFGSAWQLGRFAAPLICMQLASMNAIMCASYTLRISGKSSLSLKLRLVTSPILVLPVVLLARYGTLGAAVGLALGSTITAAIWWSVAWSSGARKLKRPFRRRSSQAHAQ